MKVNFLKNYKFLLNLKGIISMKKLLIIITSLIVTINLNCLRNKNIIDPNNLSDNCNKEISYNKILYTSNDNIFIMNMDGTNKQNLTNNMEGRQCEPHVSLKDSKIVFTNVILNTITREHQYTTYTMDINGQNMKNLANSSLRPLHPKLSPDDSYIVFVATGRINNKLMMENSDIYVMNSDGTNLKNLTNDRNRDWSPQFTPCGLQIIFGSEMNYVKDIYSIYQFNT